jgi:hypothetical protein
MAGVYLVPVPIAIPLIAVIIGLLPVIPVAWVWIIFTNLTRGIRQHDHPSHTAHLIGRWIGLSIVLPWVAVIALWLMVMVQLVLAPFVFFQQLRTFSESLTWASIQLGITQPSNDISPAIQETTTPDPSSLPPFTFTLLPSTSPTTIRLLSIHPGTFDSPLRGTITTTTLASHKHPPYDALSYTWSDNPFPPSTSPSPPPAPLRTQPLLLCPTQPPTSTHQQQQQQQCHWQTLPLTLTCAAAIKRLRHPTAPRTVWIDQVCINQADAAEKPRQVEVMDRIFGAARQVVVYTGEGGRDTDALFEWANGLGREELHLPGEVAAEGRRRGNLLGEGKRWRRGRVMLGVGSLGRWPGWLVRVVKMGGWERGRVDGAVEGLERLWGVWRTRGERAWGVVEAEYRVGVLGLAPAVAAAPPENLHQVLRAYFGRRWFKRLWALQEVAVPELSRVRFVCGEKVTTGERMVHLSTILKGDSTSGAWDIAGIFRPLRQPPPKGSPKRPHLLDLLIETQHLQCEDPRDKIFAVLNLAKRLDSDDTASGGLKMDYHGPVARVYATYSAQLIKWHGPGFFLALIKSSPNVEGLPSWAADWTVPWPNQRAVAGMQSVGRIRGADAKDEALGFETDETSGRMIMKIMRPRVVRGFFTRDGHIDGAERTHIENVRQLGRDEILVEMYPGLTLLLRKERGESERYIFVRACPHGLSRESVEKGVAGWSKVVVNHENLGRQNHNGSPPKGYLSLPGIYQIV